MTKALTLKDRVFSFNTTGRVGRSQYFGNARFGNVYFGSNNEFFAIYQNRYNRKDKVGGKNITKMKFYYPEDPKTSNQLALRQRFASAHNFYKSLVNTGFFDALKGSTIKGMTYYNRAISLFIKQKPNYFGSIVLGDNAFGKEFIL